MKKIIGYSLSLLMVATLFVGCTKTTADLVPPTANAGPSLAITAPISSATVTGTGSTTNGNITGYLWSLVSGPNVPVITSPSSATTTVTGLVVGSYILQFAVFDQAGLAGLDTMKITVAGSPIQTLTVQPTNNASEGVVISNGNTGPDTQLTIGTWTLNGGTINYRQYVKFDFSAIPSTATILTANLYLYAMPNPHGGDLLNPHTGPTNAFYIDRVTSSWTLASLTWAGQPATSVTNRVTVAQSVSAFQDENISVTALVKDMMTSGNNGFKFTGTNEVLYNIRQYASSLNSNASLHPKLVITYQ